MLWSWVSKYRYVFFISLMRRNINFFSSRDRSSFLILHLNGFSYLFLLWYSSFLQSLFRIGRYSLYVMSTICSRISRNKLTTLGGSSWLCTCIIWRLLRTSLSRFWIFWYWRNFEVLVVIIEESRTLIYIILNLGYRSCCFH